MTLSELEQHDKGVVYVLNATTGDLNGQILISVPKKNGNGSDMVRVPKTFIPIDLTAQVTRSQLMESSEFRKTVTNGLVKLVTPEYATLLLSSDQGKEEKRRIENEINKARTVLANTGVTDGGDAEEEEDDYVDRESIGKEAKKAANKAAGGESAKVSIKLQTLVNSAAEDELSQKEIIGKLLNYNGGSLTKAEIDFLHKKYKDKPRIMTHLRSAYAALKDAA